MIVIDTHIWIWYIEENLNHKLTDNQLRALCENRDDLGVSIISCWEIAKKVEIGKMTLDRPIGQWISDGLAHEGISLLSLTPEIVVDSTTLPDDFHKDPMDQLIVATARCHNCPLVTSDGRIVSYPHVVTIN